MKLLVLFLLLLVPVGAQEAWDSLDFYPLKRDTYSLSGRLWTSADRQPEEGTVLIHNGTIEAVNSSPTGIATRGLIFAGLIDLHDHIGYAYAPRFAGFLWREDRQFGNRYQWQELTQEFHEKHSQASHNAGALSYLFGEIRELVGGTTSVANHVSGSAYEVLARNLDGDSRVHGLPIDIGSAVYFFERDGVVSKPPAFRLDPNTARQLENSDLLLVHLAEGRRDDELTRKEIESFLSWAERNPGQARKIVPIHLVGLQAADFRRFQELGIDRVIWSPAGNLALYGQTMDVGAALEAGFTVALGTDWYPSGSDSLFDELRLAKQLVRNGHISALDDDTLNAMLLEAPAKILGGGLGAILPGLPADLVVVPWEGSLNSSLQKADVDNLILVTVSGQPMFGRLCLMESLLSSYQRSPQRPQSYAYGFDFRPVLEGMRERFRDSTLLEPLGEFIYFEAP